MPRNTAVVSAPKGGSLARLALDSGGASTGPSNDAGLAFTKAMKRMACNYALAIRDDDPRDDRRKSVTVGIRRPGLTAVHASAYALRSDAAKEESVLRAAHLAPGLFDTGTVRAVLLPLRPASTSRWTAQIALSFPVLVPRAGNSGRGCELGVVLQSGSTIVHRVQRSVRLGPTGEASSSQARVTFLESVDIPPGKYTLSAVLSDPAIPAPQSVAIDVELPRVPRGELFLVGPLLGQRSSRNVVVRSRGSDSRTGAPGVSEDARDSIGDVGGFEPLVGPLLDTPTDVVAVTQVCAVAAGDTIAAPLVTRTLRSASGPAIGQFAAVRVSLDGSGELRCASLIDELPAGALKPGGEYVFEAGIAEGSAGSSRSAHLRVGPAGDAGAIERTVMRFGAEFP